MKNLIKGFLVIGFLAILSGCSYKIVKNNENIDSNSVDLEKTAANSELVATSPETTSKEVYFGSLSNDKYSFLNIRNGETKNVIPDGYQIVSQYNYDTFSEYFIIQKDNDLFSLKLEGQNIEGISDKFTDLKLRKNEEAYVEPSITEKDKFHIVINEYDPEKMTAMGINMPINTRSYFFDASLGKINQAKNVKLENCYKYDSKNERFFTWFCGEGYGYAIPLFVKDLDGNDLQEAISLADYGLVEGEKGLVFVKYNNGMFVALEKNTPSRLTVVNPSTKELTKEVYTINDEVKLQLKDYHLDGATIDKDNKTIILEKGNDLLLLKYSSDNTVIESKNFSDTISRTNSTILYNGKIFYQSQDALNIIDASSWQKEKTIPLEEGWAITLIN